MSWAKEYEFFWRSYGWVGLLVPTSLFSSQYNSPFGVVNSMIYLVLYIKSPLSKTLDGLSPWRNCMTIWLRKITFITHIYHRKYHSTYSTFQRNRKRNRQSQPRYIHTTFPPQSHQSTHQILPRMTDSTPRTQNSQHGEYSS